MYLTDYRESVEYSLFFSDLIFITNKESSGFWAVTHFLSRTEGHKAVYLWRIDFLH